jgi:hypothetical protein
LNLLYSIIKFSLRADIQRLKKSRIEYMYYMYVHVFVLKKVSAQICNFFQFLSLFLLQFAAALFSRANKTTPVRFENV